MLPRLQQRSQALRTNYVPIAARLLTLTDHPGLDLIVVLNPVGDAAAGCHARSGLVMEMPRFHDTLRKRTNAAGMTAVPQSGREPLPFIVRSPAGATPFVLTASIVEETGMAKKRKRKYSRGAGTEVKREMHRYKQGKAKSGKGGKAAR